MNTRLKQFIAAENITQAQLADTINVVRASVSHILAGRNKPSYEFISGLMRHYPMLNIEWLMFGKGKMYKDKDNAVHNADLFSDNQEDTPSLDDFAALNGTESQAIVHEVPEIQSPERQDTSVLNVMSINEIKTLINEVQKPVTQRKLIKITAFFDDGTFQVLTTL